MTTGPARSLQTPDSICQNEHSCRIILPILLTRSSPPIQQGTSCSPREPLLRLYTHASARQSEHYTMTLSTHAHGETSFNTFARKKNIINRKQTKHAPQCCQTCSPNQSCNSTHPEPNDQQKQHPVQRKGTHHSRNIAEPKTLTMSTRSRNVICNVTTKIDVD